MLIFVFSYSVHCGVQMEGSTYIALTSKLTPEGNPCLSFLQDRFRGKMTENKDLGDRLATFMVYVSPGFHVFL